MRVVVSHNFYQQAGGEDRVFADETALLRAHGHEVVTFTRHNDSVSGQPPWSLAARALWNRSAARELEGIVRDHRAEVVHFHNTLPLISPAAYYAARRAGAAVVQTLHNYRLLCPRATLYRDGGPCERCVGKALPWPAVQYGCYRDSRPASLAVATMLVLHRWLGTYHNMVDAYIALSQFARDKLIASGLPADKIHLRPNFMLEDLGPGSGAGRYVLYLGRLAPEKGVTTLLEAWGRHDPGIPLVICGRGPLEPLVAQVAADRNRVVWVAGCTHQQAMQRLGEALLLVLPSVWYEACPKTILEAYCKGTPVVASRLGALAELVQDNISGSCFVPGNAADLAATVRRLCRDSDALRRMRANARRLFETNYSPAVSYPRLLQIYDAALHLRHGLAARRTAAETATPPEIDETLMESHSNCQSSEVCPL